MSKLTSMTDDEKARAEKRMWANLAANPPIRKVAVTKVYVLCSCAAPVQIRDGRFLANDAEVVGVFGDKQGASDRAEELRRLNGRLYYIVEQEITP